MQLGPAAAAATALQKRTEMILTSRCFLSHVTVSMLFERLHGSPFYFYVRPVGKSIENFLTDVFPFSALNISGSVPCMNWVECFRRNKFRDRITGTNGNRFWSIVELYSTFGVHNRFVPIVRCSSPLVRKRASPFRSSTASIKRKFVVVVN